MQRYRTSFPRTTFARAIIIVVGVSLAYHLLSAPLTGVEKAVVPQTTAATTTAASGRLSTHSPVRRSSSHHCVGLGFGALMACEVMNVCYESGQFRYYVPTNESQRVPFDYGPAGATYAGSLNYRVPAAAIAVTGNRRELGGVSLGVDFRLFERAGAPPASAVWKQGPTVLHWRYVANNWGHFMMEDVLPVFFLLSTFGSPESYLRDDVRFLFSNECKDAINPRNDDRSVGICERNSKNLFGAMTKLPLETVAGLGGGPVCFERLMVGSASMGFIWSHHG
jgi:hypothetical protein